VKRLFAAVLTACFLSTTVVADENTESTVDSKWAFGLQAAPLLFGLSLRRAITDTWQVQGVLQPAGNDISVGARVLRISTKKEAWRSYLFAGIAHERDDSPGFIFEGEDNDFQETAVTAGFGLDWFWNAKNPSAPPFALSVELGLGYSEENFDDDFVDEEDDLFLAIGAGIHYQFQ